jgi:hypothetical protein
MLGGESSSEDDKIMADIVSNLVKIEGENNSKCAQKVKS